DVGEQPVPLLQKVAALAVQLERASGRGPLALADEVERLPPRRDVGDQVLAPLALLLGDRRGGRQRAQERDLPVVAGAAIDSRSRCTCVASTRSTRPPLAETRIVSR